MQKSPILKQFFSKNFLIYYSSRILSVSHDKIWQKWPQNIAILAEILSLLLFLVKVCESLTCFDIPLSAFTDLLLAKLSDSRRSSSAIWESTETLVLEVSDAADMSDMTDSLFDVDDVSDNVDGDLVSFIISGEGSGDGGGEWASSLTGGGASS